MKITTEDCVNAIMNQLRTENMNKLGPITSSTNTSEYFVEMERLGYLIDGNNWKRRAKYGSKTDKITREFENIKTGDKFYVYATEEKILEIVPMETPKPTEDEPYPELAIDFKHKVICDFGIIYTDSKHDSQFGNREWDNIDNEELEEDGYSKFTLKKGTRIGYFDAGEDKLNGVLVATSDMNYYNYEKGMTCDGIITFEVSKNRGFVPAQEPSDCITNEYGWEDVEHKAKLKGFVKKYKLNHCLLSM